MSRVLASAVVDELLSKGDDPLWRVTVTGKPPHDVERIYHLYGVSDNRAAFEGIERFVKEMEQHAAQKGTE